MRLNDIQKQFKDTILDPAVIENNADFAGIFPVNNIPASDRMKIYRNNVIHSLTSAVTAVYPMIEKLVGEEFLKKAVNDYVVDYLPDQGNLNFYGSTFPVFIRGYEPARDFPYLHDMARLEWAWECASLAKDDQPLDPALLQDIPQDDIPLLTLSLRDSVSLIESQYPLDRIVDFCRDEIGEETLDLDTGGACLMIFRPELKPHMRKLDQAEYRFLQALSDDCNLLAASESAMTIDPDFNLAHIFQKHLELGTFSEIGDKV